MYIEFFRHLPYYKQIRMSTEQQTPVIEIAGGAIEAGGVKLADMPIKKLRARAKKNCVKASGTKSKIAANIKRAKKSKSAKASRCRNSINKARRAARMSRSRK